MLTHCCEDIKSESGNVFIITLLGYGAVLKLGSQGEHHIKALVYDSASPKPVKKEGDTVTLIIFVMAQCR